LDVHHQRHVGAFAGLFVAGWHFHLLARLSRARRQTLNRHRHEGGDNDQDL
jgi:hypothetical protein